MAASCPTWPESCCQLQRLLSSLYAWAGKPQTLCDPTGPNFHNHAGEALDAELIVAFETEVETGKDACSRETTAGAVLNG